MALPLTLQLWDSDRKTQFMFDGKYIQLVIAKELKETLQKAMQLFS